MDRFALLQIERMLADGYGVVINTAEMQLYAAFPLLVARFMAAALRPEISADIAV